MPPEVFTQTPIEGHIIALCMKYQIAAARILVGTPVIKAAFFVILAVFLIWHLSRMGLSKLTPGETVGKLCWSLGCIILSIAFLSSGVRHVNFSSFGDKNPWVSKNGVASNSSYDSTLRSNSNEGLFWYLQLSRAISGVTDTMTRAIASASNDPSLIKDPTFLYKQLAKSSLAAAGVGGSIPAAKFDALVRDCSDTKNGKIISRANSLREIFDTSTTHCNQLWSDFEGQLSTFGDNLLRIYKPTSLGPIYDDVQKYGVNGPRFIKNLLVSNALLNYSRSRAGFNDPNSTKNSEATFSDTGDRMVEDVSTGPVAAGYMYIAKLFMKDPHASAMKAEAANRFNQFSSILPVARGWIHGVLAILFVGAALALGFQAIRPMQAWLLAMGTISLYKPISILGYKIAEYFTNKSDFLMQMKGIQNDPLLLGGVKVIQDQIIQMQTVYLAFEIGVFAIFVAGAIGCFRALTNFSNTLGHAAMAKLGSVGQTLAHEARHMSRQSAHHGGGGAASDPTVNVNVGHWPTQSASFAGQAPMPPSSWDDGSGWSAPVGGGGRGGGGGHFRSGSGSFESSIFNESVIDNSPKKTT